MRPVSVALPLGIGDCHWACTKLTALSEHHDGRPVHAFVNRSANHNTVEFLKLVGPVDAAAYDRRAPYSINKQLMGGPGHPRWAELKSAGPWRGFDYVFVPNGHLEAGKPLSSWLPKLDTEYDYPLEIPADAVKSARRLAGPGSVLLYPSGTGPNTQFHGNWWQPKDWAAVVKLLNAEGIEPVLVGAKTPDDLGYGKEVLKAVKRKKAEAVDLIGKTSTSEVMSLIVDAAAWCGLNSGLGIVAAAQRVPTVMFWADRSCPVPGQRQAFVTAMQTSWVSDSQMQTYRPMSFGAFGADDVLESLLDLMLERVAA